VFARGSVVFRIVRHARRSQQTSVKRICIPPLPHTSSWRNALVNKRRCPWPYATAPSVQPCSCCAERVCRTWALELAISCCLPALQAGRSRVRFPDEVIWCLHLPYPSSSTVTQGSTHHPTEMSTGNIPGGGDRARSPGA
jgi:hypothetical protein